MGFVLPRNPNPLVGALNTLTQTFTKRATEDRENKLIGDAFQKLNDPNISPLEQLVTLSQLDVSPEKRKMLTEGFSTINEQAAKAQKAQQERQRNVQVAQHLGLENPEQYADHDPSTIVAIHKQKNPVAKGGISAQPIPEEHLNKIEEIENANPKASPGELIKLFAKAQIPESSYKLRVETKGKEGEASNKNLLTIHEYSEDADKEIINASKTARKQLEAAKDIEEAVRSKKVQPNSVSNWFRGFGKIGDKIADAFKNAEQGKFEAALPQLIEGWKDVFGVRLSDADLKIIQDKLPSIGKSAEANEAILKVIRKYAQPLIDREQIGRQIKKENNGYRPLNYTDMIEERLEAMNEPVMVISPKSGKPVSIPRRDLQAALDAGGKLANE